MYRVFYDGWSPAWPFGDMPETEARAPAAVSFYAVSAIVCALWAVIGWLVSSLL